MSAPSSLQNSSLLPSKPGQSSSQKFKDADEFYKDKIGSMSEEEKSLLGLPYIAIDPKLIEIRTNTRKLVRKYNQSEAGPEDENEKNATDVSNKERRKILMELFKIDEAKAHKVCLEPPFWCDFGTNMIFEGPFYANFNFTCLDAAKVTFGADVLCGPNVHIYAATHSVSVTEREDGWERALPISIGRDSWIGGNVTILAGVNIGQGCTIAAGSIVTRDCPDWSVVAGNPSRVVKTLDVQERGKRYKPESD